MAKKTTTRRSTNTRRAAAVCQAEGCSSRIHKVKDDPANDLCERHWRMSNADPCVLDHCRRPAYAQKLCEAHYRRKIRGSAKWDEPLIDAERLRGELVFVATRVHPSVRDAIQSTLPPKRKVYGKIAEILEEWVQRNVPQGRALTA